jgi:hypothetical protein
MISWEFGSWQMNSAEYYNKVQGGWLGRVAGSHIGAPLRSDEIPHI